jgi:hypothetical protein
MIMRIRLIALALLLSLSAAAQPSASVQPSATAQPKRLNAETAIQTVTIYSSGARVERIATVGIQSGHSEISFTGLSNQLDQSTVQLKADADITLLSVQATRDFLTERKIDQQEQELIDRSAALKDRLDLDQKLAAVNTNEEGMLVKNQEIGGQTGVKTADLKEALEFQRQRLTELYARQLDIQKRIASEQRELAKDRAQLQEISTKRDSVNFIVTALVDSKDARTVNFQLMYNVKDAGWYPTYDVRVSEITEPLSVLMHANIFQRSGEIWKNIPLQLSTGNPKDNATSSPLEPWLLGFYDPSEPLHGQTIQGEMSGRVTNEKGEPVAGASVQIKGAKTGVTSDENGYFKLQNLPKYSVVSISGVGYQPRQVVGNAGYLTVLLTPSVAALNDVVVVGYGGDLEGSVAGLDFNKAYKKDIRAPQLQTVLTTTQYQPTVMVYRIDEKYTLEPDGKTTTIGIKQLSIPAGFQYYAAPKVDPTAFLTARIIDWQDYGLQSGEASLYFEGTYLGKTYLDLASTADTLSLSLGRDNSVKIFRKLVKEYTAKKFIGSNRTDTRQYEISVRNSKHVPVNITLLDQIPVSVTKEISVEEIKAAEAQLDKDTGIATWTIALAPGQERKLAIAYTVKYPRERRVVLE